MTTTAHAANVVYLETHPAWRSSRRRSQELMAAMRRHPSYQGSRAESSAERAEVLVLPVHAH